MTSAGRHRHCSLSSDNQKFVDQLVSDILRDSFLIHSTREKYVSHIPPARRRHEAKSRTKGEAGKGGRRKVRSQSEYRGRQTPTLFATSDLTPRLREAPRCLYVSLHDLPGAASFSYKDDTICDSLEDLIANQVQRIQKNQQQQGQSCPEPEADPAEVSKTLDFLMDPASPIRSQKGRERVLIDPDFDDQYDEYFSSFPSFRVQRNDSGKEPLTRSFSFTERIISCNLKHHQPDDFDVESLTIRVKKAVRTAKSRDEAELSVRNLPFLLTSLNLSKNTLL